MKTAYGIIATPSQDEAARRCGQVRHFRLKVVDGRQYKVPVTVTKSRGIVNPVKRYYAPSRKYAPIVGTHAVKDHL